MMCSVRTSLLLLSAAVCVLWISASAEEDVTSQTETPILAVNITTVPASTNSCTSNKDCKDTSVMHCDIGTGECLCKDDTLVLTNSHHCLPGRSLDESCQDTKQCELLIEHAVCSAEGKCVCADGYFLLLPVNASSCESNANMVDKGYAATATPPTGPRHNVDPNMIIIMVVLAVMFIGICVALHLFSKARFRNHRTIFNSPHPRLMHIKLGKKKGRRRASHTSLEVPGSRQLSICSQLSPVQSRRGSKTSPDFNRKSQKSIVDKKENSRINQLQKDSPSISSADNSVHKGAPSGKHTANSDTPVSSSAAANGPGSPKVVVSNRTPAQPSSSSSARA